jgi:molybdopterin-guanine dinucleotide biosynthesis protein A
VAKGLERVGGERIIDRVAAALRESCDDLIIVANDPAATEWIPGTRVVADVRPSLGALSGVHAALSHAREAIVVLPWDAPFVPGAMLVALRAAGEKAGADAAVAASNSLWGFEPLCGWYRTTCLAAIERHLDAGDLRAGGWLGDVKTIHLDVSPWGDPDEIFFNVNSSADLAIAESHTKRAT